MAFEQPLDSKPSPTWTLIGFTPFFRKELREWQQKRVAIAFFLLAALLGGMIMLALVNFFSQQGVATSARSEVITGAATTYASNPIWITLISIFSAMGVLIREQDNGTLAWNLSKPLSRSALLTAKWLGTTLMIWLLGVVLQNAVLTTIELLRGPDLPDIALIFTTHLGAFCAIGFWVLLCLLLSCFLKESAGVGAGALLVSFAPLLLGNLPPAFQPLLNFYPTNLLDWAVALPLNLPKLFGYLVWMGMMAIAANTIFGRKEF